MFTDLKANYGECDTLPFTNSSGSDLSAGDIHTVQDKVGIVYEDTPDTEDGVLVVGVPKPGVVVPKLSGDGAWSRGEKIYLDEDGSGNSNNEFTNQSSTNGTTNPVMGYAYEDAASGDNEARVVLTDEVR